MYLVLLVYDMMHLDQLFTVFQKKKVKCIKIDGQTPVTTRQTLVTDFQNKDGIRAAVVRCYPSYMFSIQFQLFSQITLNEHYVSGRVVENLFLCKLKNKKLYVEGDNLVADISSSSNQSLYILSFILFFKKSAVIAA